MKLRSVSLLILGQMTWLTAACSTISHHRPADNWSMPSPQVKTVASSPHQLAGIEASPVDGRMSRSEGLSPPTQVGVAAEVTQIFSAKRGQVPAMSIGVRESAPEGLRDFCRRQPQFCNVAATTRPRPERQEDGFMLTGLGPDLSDAFPSRFVASASAQPIRAFTSTRQDLALIGQINRQINRAMIGVTDQIAFGRTEFWTMPLSAPEYSSMRARPLADCEDFALEKRRALIEAGIPERSIYLAVAVSPRTSLHAVLVVATDQGDFVLDNLNDWVVGFQETGYTWVKRQSTTSLLDWADVIEPDQPSLRRLVQVETRVPTPRLENEAQSPTLAMAAVWEAGSENADMSEPVVLSIRPTGGRSR